MKSVGILAHQTLIGVATNVVAFQGRSSVTDGRCRERLAHSCGCDYFNASKYTVYTHNNFVSARFEYVSTITTRCTQQQHAGGLASLTRFKDPWDIAHGFTYASLCCCTPEPHLKRVTELVSVRGAVESVNISECLLTICLVP